MTRNEPVLRALSEFDDAIHSDGVAVFAGVDEAGRGPLAGSVYAGAVILLPGTEIPYLNDSKKLTEKRREQLFDVICDTAVAVGIGEATVAEIEELNILNAAMLAMRRAVDNLHTKNGEQIIPELLLIDGDKARGFLQPAQCVIGGDARSLSIAAASVLAKVSRDRSMISLAEVYPQYGFEKHKGYGTKAHYAALDTYGLTPAHRPSFLKKYFAARSAQN